MNRYTPCAISSVTPSTNMIDFPIKSSATSPFTKLTAQTVLAQFRAGSLPEPVLVALLAGVGLWP